MNLEEKLQAIVQAAHSAVPFKRIDIKGQGNAVRRLLDGSQPCPRKIEEMYANLLAYQEFELQTRTQQQLNISPDATLTLQQKRNLILEALQKGIPKSRLDTKGGGKAPTRLQRGHNVSTQKLDEMYLNLLSFAGHRVEHDSISPTCPSCHRLTEKVKSLELIISSLFDRIVSLEAGVQKLQKELDLKKELDSKPPKILGVTLLRKTDVVHGRKYSRWYGLYYLNGKRVWIYIGKDVSKAKSKIQSWLDSHVSGDSQ